MKRAIRDIALSVTAVALLFSSENAAAKIKEVKFHVVQSEFEDSVVMDMKYDGENWVWANESKQFNTRIKLYFNASGVGGHLSKLILKDTNAVLWSLPAGYTTNKYEELVTVSIGKTILSPFQGKAKALCDFFGGRDKVVRQMDVDAQMQVWRSTGDHVNKNGVFPIQVTCQPKPIDPVRTPVELKVTQINLYTIPAQPTCGKPVTLYTEIQTNKPGSVDFYLTRSDGLKQLVTIATNKVGDSYINRWSKTYTHTKSIDLRYQIILANQPMASNWADMKIICGANTNIDRPGSISK